MLPLLGKDSKKKTKETAIIFLELIFPSFFLTCSWYGFHQNLRPIGFFLERSDNVGLWRLVGETAEYDEQLPH